MKKQVRKQLASVAIPPNVDGLTKASKTPTSKATAKSNPKTKKIKKGGRDGKKMR